MVEQGPPSVFLLSQQERVQLMPHFRPAESISSESTNVVSGETGGLVFTTSPELALIPVNLQCRLLAGIENQVVKPVGTKKNQDYYVRKVCCGDSAN